MTVAECAALVRKLCGQTSSVGPWADSVLTDLINMANAEIWSVLSNELPDRCLTSSEVTYTANATSVAVGGSSKVMSMLYVGVKQSSGAVSSTNAPVAIWPEGYFSIEDFAGSAMWPYYDRTWAGDTRWALVGDNLVALRPIPGTALYLHVKHIVDVVDLTASGTLLNSKLYPAHRLVAYRTAQLAQQRAGQSFSAMAGMEERHMAETLRALKPQRYGPMQVRDVYGPD